MKLYISWRADKYLLDSSIYPHGYAGMISQYLSITGQSVIYLIFVAPTRIPLHSLVAVCSNLQKATTSNDWQAHSMVLLWGITLMFKFGCSLLILNRKNDFDDDIFCEIWKENEGNPCIQVFDIHLFIQILGKETMNELQLSSTKLQL